MIGKWKGTYGYDNRKGFENAKLIPVEFDVEIVAMENETFTGFVEDNIEMGGTPGVGQITGSVDQSSVVFEKNMPAETMHFQNGETKVDINKKHPAIIYTGTLENKIITGNWKFKKMKFMWLGIIPWWYDLGSGTFTMQKME
jgi:hypothetical protein